MIEQETGLFQTINDARVEAKKIAEFYNETVVVTKHIDGFEIEMYPEWANTDKEVELFVEIGKEIVLESDDQIKKSNEEGANAFRFTISV